MVNYSFSLCELITIRQVIGKKETKKKAAQQIVSRKDREKRSASEKEKERIEFKRFVVTEKR